MAEPNPAKAELRELDAKFENEINKDKWVVVQFNPETLKVSYANQIAQPSGAGDQRGADAQLFVGAGTTKLTCQLWFDVSAPQSPQPDGTSEPVDDVRKLTGRVSYFITPQPDKKDKKRFIPPAVRFIWGSFQFDGIFESLEESLEFFSPEGRPLRASMSLSMAQQKIIVFPPRPLTSPAGGGDAPGTKEQTPVPAGGSVQSVAAKQGKGSDWQSIATANNVENPRRPKPGQLLDTNPPRRP